MGAWGGPGQPRRRARRPEAGYSPPHAGRGAERSEGSRRWKLPSSNCKPDRGLREGAWSGPSRRGAPSVDRAAAGRHRGCSPPCVVAAAGGCRRPSPSLATGVGVAVLVAAALVDAVEHRLPERLVALAARARRRRAVAVGSADLRAAPLAGRRSSASRCSSPTSSRPRGMGFGDVKAGPCSAPRSACSMSSSPCWPSSSGWRRRPRGASPGAPASIPLGPALVAGALPPSPSARLAGVGHGGSTHGDRRRAIA